MGLELVLIVVLILFNGVLTLSELSVVSARRLRLQQRAEAGDVGARAALALQDEPTRFLSTVQIGITMVGILTGAFGGATLAGPVRGLLEDAGLSTGVAGATSVVLVVLLITYLSLVVGELVPKRLAMQSPERLAALVARPMRMLSVVSAPAVFVLSASTDLVLRLLRIRPKEEPPVTEEELRLLLQQSSEAGVIEAAEREIANAVFRLGDRQLAELMVPRALLDWIDVTDTPEQQREAVVSATHERMLVCRENPDSVLGVVSIKDLLRQVLREEPLDVSAVLTPALVLPESMTALLALERFKQAGVPLAVLIDEYGGTSGVVTLTDLLEAIVGDIPVADDPEEASVQLRPDGTLLVDGLLSVDELKQTLLRDSLPNEDEYQTVAGFVMLQLGRVPETGEGFIWEGIRFDVVEMDGRRVDKVLITPGVTV